MRRFTVADSQAYALNLGYDSDTARDFADFVQAVQDASDTLSILWHSYQQTRQDEALDC